MIILLLYPKSTPIAYAFPFTIDLSILVPIHIYVPLNCPSAWNQVPGIKFHPIYTVYLMSTEKGKLEILLNGGNLKRGECIIGSGGWIFLRMWRGYQL